MEELNGQWSNGPEKFWPQEAMKAVSEEEMERRQVKVIREVKKVEQAINPEKLSSWRKCMRVTARIQRLAKKISSRKHAQEERNGPLTPEKLERAEIFWIKAAQNDLHRQKEKGEFNHSACSWMLKVYLELEEEWIRLSSPMMQNTLPFFQVITGSPC